MNNTLQKKFSLVKTERDYRAWVIECRDRIQELRNVKQITFPGTRQKHFTEIARIKCLLHRAARDKSSIKFGGGGNNVATVAVDDRLIWENLDSAFKNRICSGMVVNSNYIDPRKFLLSAEELLQTHINIVLNSVNCIKVNCSFNGQFFCKDNSDEKHISTMNSTSYKTDNFSECEFQERHSGWTLEKIYSLIVNINHYNPLQAGCQIQLPSSIMCKKAVINVKTSDNACFAWSVTASLYPAQPPAVVGSITFPITLNQILKFEVDNDVSVNTFTLEEQDDHQGRERVNVAPLQLTKKKRDPHVNLLMITDEEGTAHFMCITSLSRLLHSQLTKRGHVHHICDRYLHYFHTVEKLKLNELDCEQLNDNLRVVLPSEGEDRWLSFKNVKNCERVPFVIYADLACILEKTDQSEDNSNSNSYQKHVPFSVGYYIKSSRDSSFSSYNSYRGTDCIEWFVRELESDAQFVSDRLKTVVPMSILSVSEGLRHYSDPNCHICKKPFLPNQLRIRDHDHLTGKHKGPAHNNCNLNFKDSHVIPIIFHNLSGYDSHFIFEAIANYKFLRHYNIHLRFIDSFKFMASSLDKLSSYLEESQLKNLVSQFPGLTEEQYSMLTRKGIFPYDYIDCISRLGETTLPPRELFYNRLSDSHITEEAYNHAKDVWTKFKIRTLGEYSDLYLKTDILLLDPAHYYTLPSFTWDAKLKHTGIKLELFTDVDMLLFIERGIRGDLSQCSYRYEKANNRYMQDLDPAEPSKYLMYYDVNHLYGWAMCQPLLTHGFRWIENIDNFDINSVPEDSSAGYILEVDLEYPRKLHDRHSNLPFCPVREKPPGSRQEKLLATLNDKIRYVIHYRILQQCIRNGIRLTRIYRGLQFQQFIWLREYIKLNKRLRTESKNDFEKNLFKLMNNALFGKTMEKVRNRIDVKLATKWEGRYGAEALNSKLNFYSRTIFNENLVAIKLSKLSAKFNKPVYVRMSILDISKTYLFDFHYDYMLPAFGSKCRALYTDTDSLIYSIECDDVYSVMKNDITKFDTSDYPSDNQFSLPLANKKVPGLMKDENNVQGCTKIIKNVKGVKGYVVDRSITFDDYRDSLNNFNMQSRNQNSIRSKLHKVFSITQKKIALSPHDDKRFITPGTVATLLWGHCRLKE
ncbi:uncharacterized protein [Prorops nasuta]|uniref:uncharacterized protein n=1 Tax=Prorops nasuta TaxID=863751 RepID=UPI0034CEF1F8